MIILIIIPILASSFQVLSPSSVQPIHSQYLYSFQNFHYLTPFSP